MAANKVILNHLMINKKALNQITPEERDILSIARMIDICVSGPHSHEGRTFYMSKSKRYYLGRASDYGGLGADPIAACVGGLTNHPEYWHMIEPVLARAVLVRPDLQGQYDWLAKEAADIRGRASLYDR